MIFSRIIGVGSYLPEKILTNYDLEKMVDTTDEWIRQRTGISQRHIAHENETVCEMSLNSIEHLFQQHAVDKNEIDLIIVATSTQDLIYPSTAMLISEKLGISATGFDIQVACSGFVYALKIANDMMKTGQYRKCIVVGVDKNSKIVNWEDRNTCVLFGDGAGCVLLESFESENNNLDTSFSHIMDGITGGNPNKDILFADKFIEMNGQEVFKKAVVCMPKIIKDILNRSKLTIEDIDLIVPHQANYRIIDNVTERLNISKEKVIMTMNIHANTSAASIPLAMNVAIQNGKLKKGDVVITEAFGAGLTWGGNLFVF